MKKVFSEKSNIFRGKKGELSSEEIVGAVIVILIVLLVGGFYISNNPNWLYKLIPDLNQTYGDDKEIPIPTMPDGSPIQGLNPCLSEGKVAVAVILREQVIQIGRIQENGQIDVLGKDYYKHSAKYIGWDAAKNVVQVNGKEASVPYAGKVEIYKKYLTHDTDFYFNLLISGESLSARGLATLDGAELKGNYFCKPFNSEANYISSNYIGSWPDSYEDLFSFDWTTNLKDSKLISREGWFSKNAIQVSLSDTTGYLVLDGAVLWITPDENYFKVYKVVNRWSDSEIGIIAPDGYLYLNKGNFNPKEIPQIRVDYFGIGPEGRDPIAQTWPEWFKTPFYVDYLKLSENVNVLISNK